MTPAKLLHEATVAAEYTGFAAGEVVHAIFGAHQGDEAIHALADALGDLFEHCERETAAFALALELAPILRPKLFERES